MGDRIIATSTTDSDADVQAALGAAPPPTPADDVAAPVAPAAHEDAPPVPAAADPAVASEPSSSGDDDEDDEAETDLTDAKASDAGRTLRRRSSQARIRVLTAQREATARERDEAKAENARLTAELAALKVPASERGPDTPATEPVEPAAPAAPAAASTFATPKPKQDDFDDFDAYLEARDEWVTAKAAHEAEARYEARLAQDRAAAARQAKQAELDTRFAAARQKHPDLDEVIAAAKDTPLPLDVIHYIHESDLGAELTYYLATHPEEAAALNAMAPVRAVGALGRLEERLAAAPAPAAPRETAPGPKAVPVSKAPAPVHTVRTGSTVAVGKNPDEMTQSEYNAYRDEQERRRRVG